MGQTSRRRTRRKGRLILLVGGASCGKSALGLQIAARGLGSRARRGFVATGQPLDAEMAEKLRQHQASRDGRWATHEVPHDLVGWFRTQAGPYRAIVVDCITVWLSNLLAKGVEKEDALQATRDLSRVIRRHPARTVVVSNELGLGLVPVEPSARQFRDVAGGVNQLLAAEADEVYFVISGLPIKIK